MESLAWGMLQKMRNKLLYDELSRVFDTEVRIACEGDQGQYSCPPYIVPSYVKPKPKKYAAIEDWGETYHLNCPVCGDTKQRLFFSHLFGSFVKEKGKTGVQYDCGRIYVCHNERCDLSPYIKKMDMRALRKICVSEHAPLQSSSFFTIEEGVMPPNCIPIVDAKVPKESQEYLISRGYDLHDLYRDYSVMYVRKGDPQGPEDGANMFFEDRILIPIYQGSIGVSWQARAIGEHKRKYLFPQGFKKNQYLYNSDNALHYDSVVIVEGITDVWSVGPDAVALFGKTMSTRQLEIMRVLWGFCEAATVLLDADAYGNAVKIARQLNEDPIAFPRGVRAARLPSGDPGDYTEDELTEFIEAAWK